MGVGISKPHLAWRVFIDYFLQFDTARIDTVLWNPALEANIPDFANRIPANTYNTVRNSGFWQDLVHAYGASTSYASAQITRAMDALFASVHRDSIGIIITSDHGFHLGQKKTWRKTTAWEEVTRVPLLMYFPWINGGKPGTVSHAVSLQDLYKTLIDVYDLPRRDDLSGKSLMPYLMNPDTMLPGYALHSNSYIGHVDSMEHAMRTDNYALIRTDRGGSTIGYEFYDMVNDHDQLVDLENNPAYATLFNAHRELLDSMLVNEAWVNANFQDFLQIPFRLIGPDERVEFWEHDTQDLGRSVNDNDSERIGSIYPRPDSQIDIINITDNLGERLDCLYSFEPSEFLEYTITVPGGNYRFRTRAASDVSSAQVNIYADGTLVQTMDVGGGGGVRSGDFNLFSSGTFSLSGTAVIKVESVSADDTAFDYFEIVTQ